MWRVLFTWISYSGNTVLLFYSQGVAKRESKDYKRETQTNVAILSWNGHIFRVS